MHWEPAIVVGSESQAIAVFREDTMGDLCDIDYYCGYGDCGAEEIESIVPHRWPAYSWPDYDVHCASCGMLINKSEV